MTPPVKPPLLADCTGVLLVGGHGRRMGGMAKGNLRLHGERLASRTLRVFAPLFADRLLVGDDAARHASPGVRAVPDEVPGRGAPGGLHAALRAATTPWIFVAACDMPFLEAGSIAWLANRRAGATAVVVEWRGRLEPLHAFWSRACLPAIEQALAAGSPSLAALARAVGARVVPEAAWREVDPEGRAFANANAPEDLARLGLER